MSPTELVFLATPAVLGIFKLTALSIAAIWAVRTAFEQGRFPPDVYRH